MLIHLTVNSWHQSVESSVVGPVKKLGGEEERLLLPFRRRSFSVSRKEPRDALLKKIKIGSLP